MSITRIQVIGQSHVKALRDACHKRTQNFCETEETDIAIHWLLKKRPGGENIGDVPFKTSLDIAADLGPADLIAITVFGGFHNAIGLLNHDIPFTVLTEDAAMAPEDMPDAMIPYHVVRDIYKTQMTGEKLQCISASSSAPVYHLATPPPKKDAKYIVKQMDVYRNRSAAKSGISPAPLRLKLWQIEMEVLAEYCEEFGIVLLPPPNGSTDEEGYLLPMCYARDATHANAVYGELVLRQLEDLAGEQPESTESADAG